MQTYEVSNDKGVGTDVLSAKDALILANILRDLVLTGKPVHPIEIERLCCFVIGSEQIHRRVEEEAVGKLNRATGILGTFGLSESL